MTWRPTEHEVATEPGWQPDPRSKLRGFKLNEIQAREDPPPSKPKPQGYPEPVEQALRTGSRSKPLQSNSTPIPRGSNSGTPHRLVEDLGGCTGKRVSTRCIMHPQTPTLHLCLRPQPKQLRGFPAHSADELGRQAPNRNKATPSGPPSAPRDGKAGEPELQVPTCLAPDSSPPATRAAQGPPGIVVRGPCGAPRGTHRPGSRVKKAQGDRDCLARASPRQCGRTESPCRLPDRPGRIRPAAS